MLKNKSFWYSLSTLIGTIIGVGIFSLPYVSAQSGFSVMAIELILLSFLAIAMHLIYGEIALRTRGHHRLCGYAETYLGERGKKSTLIASIFSFYGSLFVYILVGGKFLYSLLSPYFGGAEIIYCLVFFAIGAVLIYRGMKSVAVAELWMMAVFFVVLIGLFIVGVDQISVVNFQTVNLGNMFLPYGVIIFSLWGTSIIPELKDMLAGREKILKKVIISGVMISTLVYLLFIMFVQGISGDKTTTEGLTGLAPYLGNKVLIVAYFFGILTTFTSFLSLGLTLEKTFRYDFEIKHFYSWALTVFVPLLFVLLGLTDFIKTMGIVGAFGLAFESFILLLIHRRAKKIGQLKPAYEINISHFIFYLILILVAIGAVMEISL